MLRGGFRPGSGRKLGKKSLKTLKKDRIKEAVNQRIFKIAENLIEAQTILALGHISIYEKIKNKDKSRKDKFILIEDEELVKEILSKTGGMGGIIENKFYVIALTKPDNQAINSLLDRAFGRAQQSLEAEIDTNLTINLLKYNGDNNTPPISAPGLPTPDTTGD